MSCLANADQAWSLDQAAVPTTGYSTSASVGPMTPSTSNTLFVGGFAVTGGSTTDTFTQTPFATPFDKVYVAVGANKIIYGGNLITTTLSPVTYSVTYSPTREWVAFLVSFKALGAIAVSYPFDHPFPI